MEKQKWNTTPGGNQSTIAESKASKSLDSGELATCSKKSEIHVNVKQKIKHKGTNFFTTININSFLKTGKLKQLTDTLTKHNILIAAL